MSERFESRITAKRHEGDKVVEEVEISVRGVYADYLTQKVVWRALALRGFDQIEAVGESVTPRLVREVDDTEDTAPFYRP